MWPTVWIAALVATSGFRGARTNPLQESAISNFHRALREYLFGEGAR